MLVAADFSGFYFKIVFVSPNVEQFAFVNKMNIELTKQCFLFNLLLWFALMLIRFGI